MDAAVIDSADKAKLSSLLQAASGEDADGFEPRQLLLRDGRIDLLAADGSGILTLGRDLAILDREQLILAMHLQRDGADHG